MRNDYLFVCSVNVLRSPTAEHVARLLGWHADSAGTDPFAVRPLTGEAIDRADTIVCMQYEHLKEVVALRPDCYTEVWDIPDDYDYCAPELMAILMKKIPKKSHF